MPKLTDDELRTLAANARANDGQVEKWLDRDRSLALIEEVQELRAALKEALDSMAESVEVLTDEGMLNTADRFTAQIAGLRKLVGE